MKPHRTAVIASALLLACASAERPTPLTTALNSSFRDMPLPDAATVRRNGVRRRFPAIGLDHITNSLVLLGFQHGIALAPDRRDGLFVFMSRVPLAALAENVAQDTSDVYVLWLLGIADRRARATVPDSIRARWANEFLDQLAIQIYSNDLWPFLRRSGPHPLPPR